MRAHDPPERDVPNRQTQPTRPGTGTAPLTSSMAAILTLQRRAGNAAVTRAVQRQRSDHRHSHHEHDEGLRPEAQPVQRSTVHEVLRSAGTPLAEPVRRDMETRLGADFSDVRLHTGALAQRSAAEIGARAYTSGSHVVIGQGGGDRHTLAHELTHVIQQRSGPVSGTDGGHGLRVSDPGDAFERAAEANATRALAASRPETPPQTTDGSEKPVQRAPGTQSTAQSDTEESLPIQRWAWIGGNRIQPDDSLIGDNETMRDWASDDKVRIYLSEEEFRQHVANQTDYIGNLPDGTPSAGTWVRFQPPGTTNVIGEAHSHVTLREVLTAVGSDSFTYEPFILDDLSGQEANAAYETESQVEFDRFGISDVTDKQQFGAESLFPKLGEAIADLLGRLSGSGSGTIAGLTSGPRAYDGKPAQRYLRIAWAHGKDIEKKMSNRSQLQRAKRIFSKKEEANSNLAKVVRQTRTTLDTFITSLTPGGFLGDALVAPANAIVLRPLEEFSQAFVAAMLVHTDKTLTDEEQKKLAGMPTQDADDQGEFFRKWRNLRFLHGVADAAKRGVRYAGMGQDHLDYLLRHRELLPKNIAGYLMDMGSRGKDLEFFEKRTEQRKDEVRRQETAASETSDTSTIG
ncbi:DUF4157 domain-containing protein [Micromonospora sp. CP22]|uniref:eCIS core domain-containing protein n=1 Tax=Micromonospora sp. CP22 TaxID=2580517 RepID=UPI002814AD44|nr:DUF4157 domain-containing protein [Micromonospora sp. CP22]